jgi:hypothetical protein
MTDASLGCWAGIETLTQPKKQPAAIARAATHRFEINMLELSYCPHLRSEAFEQLDGSTLLHIVRPRVSFERIEKDLCA